jgi:integrase
MRKSAALVRHVKASGLRSEADIVRCLNAYVYPRWQHRPFRDIKRGDVAALLDKIQDNHGSRQADVCLAIIRKMMNWYASRNDDYSSPIVRGMHRHNGGDHKRKRILGDDEIGAVWKACGKIGTFGALVKTLLLTGQRREKVVTMKWDDIVGGVWHIPSEAREKTSAGTLRLPAAVLDIVAAQLRIAGNPYVFAARGSGPFNSFSQRKEELDKKLSRMPAWVIHDLRRTARSLMSRAGVRPDIAERIVGHAIRGVEGVYDRHSYEDEKGEALNQLAALVERIINPPSSENIVNMRPRRRERAR